MAIERAYWLAWSKLKNVGPVAIKRLWEHFGSLAEAWQAPANKLVEVDGIGLLIADKITAQRPKLDPTELLAQHEKDNQSFWTPADPDYPALLFAINDPPPVLYYRGSLRLNDWNRLTVGIVGTRSPSNYGKRWTQKLSGYLTQEGAVIISGLALGIDTAAHTSCLRQGGSTVAVVGTGVDQVYPQHNIELYKKIVETGLVISEYPDGTGPDRTHFPQRNRIIAGLSRAILVTEAPVKSGALITARLANEYCREVYALPCSLDNPTGGGCLKVISQGAQMILGTGELLQALEEIPSVSLVTPAQTYPSMHTEPKAVSKPSIEAENMKTGTLEDLNQGTASLPHELSPLLVKVLNAVPIEPMALDQIVPNTHASVGDVLGALIELQILGLVMQLPGSSQYQRV